MLDDDEVPIRFDALVSFSFRSCYIFERERAKKQKTICRGYRTSSNARYTRNRLRAYSIYVHICSYDVMRVGTLPMLVRNTFDLESRRHGKMLKGPTPESRK